MKNLACALLIMFLCVFTPRASADWRDWWQTPEQRAAEAWEQGESEALISDAPDSGWRGLGEFQAGDFDASSQSFGERAEELLLDGQASAANRARYNKGVSESMAGRYDEAIKQFDKVLENDPDFVDAQHNREIAQQLLELQQQQQQQEQQQDGESGDQQGDQANEEQDDQQGDQQGDQQNDQQGDQQEGQAQDQQAGQSGDQQDGSGDSNGSEAANDAETAPDTSAEQEAAERQAAEQALAAEANREQRSGEPQDSSEQRSDQDAMRTTERPLTESEQAAEQLLRRIPDDPAGLLRRKLEQSHRSEYPGVRDAEQAW